MPIFAVQYLARLHANATPVEVRRRLRLAFEHVQISLVLTGWDLPPAIEEACAEETARHGARLFRWHSLLTGTTTPPPPEWQTVSLDGSPVPGYDDAPDFTFMCPNRPEVQESVTRTLDGVIRSSLYQGLFLDRIRFPSPAAEPSRTLACFCDSCHRQATEDGLDLEAARREIQSLLTDGAGAKKFLQQLFAVRRAERQSSLLDAYLDFREQSVTRIVQSAAQQAAAQGLATGLDCFSPRMTRMVGQDLAALDKTCDWIKVMTYPRVFGPAGISFELRNLADWLIAHYGLSEAEALKSLAQTSGYPIPNSRDVFVKDGLPSEAIATELRLGSELGVHQQLAGIAMVEQKGVHDSTPAQIRADLQACRDAQADGLVVSWDLWLTPAEHLTTIRNLWLPENK